MHGRIVGRGNEWSLLGVHIEAGDGHLDVSDHSRIYVVITPPGSSKH